jgi:hypothetical protein
MFNRSYPAGTVGDFKHTLLDRVLTLAQEGRTDRLVLPVALFLVLDEANGGDDTASEIIRRFNFLDVESRNVIDFYFLGWRKRREPPPPLEFDLGAFAAHRDALKAAGVRMFGGHADLVLVDARYAGGRVDLDFTNALHIDLAAAVTAERVTSAGGFLQGLIDAAEQIRTGPPLQGGITYQISDRLGLAVAKQSLLDYVLETWGKIIGAQRLSMLAVRKIGPAVDLAAY